MMAKKQFDKGKLQYDYIIDMKVCMAVIITENKKELFDGQELLVVFGHNIKSARLRRNMSIKQLAQITQYDRTCLSNIESGKQNLKFTTALKLAKELNVSFPLLFSRQFRFEAIEGEEKDFNSFQEDDFLRIFSENFQRKLSLKRQPQFKVFILTGVNESMVSRIIKRKNTNPTIRTLAAMAYAVQTEMSELFKRTC